CLLTPMPMLSVSSSLPSLVASSFSSFPPGLSLSLSSFLRPAPTTLTYSLSLHDALPICRQISFFLTNFFRFYNHSFTFLTFVFSCTFYWSTYCYVLSYHRKKRNITRFAFLVLLLFHFLSV